MTTRTFDGYFWTTVTVTKENSAAFIEDVKQITEENRISSCELDVIVDNDTMFDLEFDDDFNLQMTFENYLF